MKAGNVIVPPRMVLAKPDADDPLDYYYKPLTGRFYRARLRQAAGLLGPGPFDALLEVGYGSGIFLPELALRSHRLAAIDLHEEAGLVAKGLRRLGVVADLRTASLYELPFGDEEFDALVCLSVLEHLTDLDTAFGELHRVLRPGAVVVLGFPVRNLVTDALFRLAGYRPREIHPSGHRDILRAVERHPGFALERLARVPTFLPRDVAAYVGCRCQAR